MGMIWAIIFALPFIFGIVFIVEGHLNAKKSKAIEKETGERMTGMRFVAILHEICGYVLVVFYGLVFIIQINW